MSAELLKYEEDIERGQEHRRSLINKYCQFVKWNPGAGLEAPMLAEHPWLLNYDPYITGVWSV